MSTMSKERVAITGALLLLAVALLPVFRALHAWAAATFARPALGAPLLGVIELACVVGALTTAPALAQGIRALLGRRRDRTDSP